MNNYGEAWAYWYREVARDLYLREGKRELGDIDLVMSHPSGVQLLVEAKNHALPLPVYFKSVSHTVEHLGKTKLEWEAKVVQRREHLKRMGHMYGIEADIQYVIVTQNPEPLTHYSDVLTLAARSIIRP